MATSPAAATHSPARARLRDRVLGADTAAAITPRRIRGRRRQALAAASMARLAAAFARTPQAGYQALASAWSREPGHWTAQPAIRHASSPTLKIHREPAALNGLHTHIDAMIDEDPDGHRRDLAAPRR